MKHGVARTDDGELGFWWLGQPLSLEEFNLQVIRSARQVLDEMDAMAQGMDIAQLCQDARRTALDHAWIAVLTERGWDDARISELHEAVKAYRDRPLNL